MQESVLKSKSNGKLKIGFATWGTLLDKVLGEKSTQQLESWIAKHYITVTQKRLH